MEAGPRDTSQQQSDPETLVPERPEAEGAPADPVTPDDRGLGLLDDPVALEGSGDPGDGAGLADPAALGDAELLGDVADLDDPESLDGPAAPGESFRDLRPPRRLRIWQIAPIVGLAIFGSLMFAFPLAFEFGDGGAVVAMLGLLLSCCAAGWGLMAARRVGYTWPGLPPRGSGRRPDWRFVFLYIAVVALIAALAILRVARLR